MTTKTVIKRNGTVEPFDKEKIVGAVAKAMCDVELIDRELAMKVADNIEKLPRKRLHIEDIQDLVEDELMDSSHKDVARAYVRYRHQREIERDVRKVLDKKILDVVSCANVQNANANVDEYSFGGRKFESAGAIHKEIALSHYVRREVADAHREFRAYIHDLDSYDVGMHNCLFADVRKQLREGFKTRNGDVRGANSFSTACQLVAVIFQCQSQGQFGGVGDCEIDYTLAPYVKISLTKYFKRAMKRHYNIDFKEQVSYGDTHLSEEYPLAWEYALEDMDRHGMQSTQGLYHNLNTLESRPGSQLPFTSINFGRDLSPEGKKVSEWLLRASLEGVGKNHSTAIFPISIFKYKKGVNDKPGTAGYDLKKLAIESLSKRIYPNFVNCDWSKNVEDPNDSSTHMSTMGCRTLIGFDRHGLGYSKVGRGNVAPSTINLPKIGIRHGICLGDREKPDLKGFYEELDNLLEITVVGLVDRFYHICSQSPKSAPFMYRNGTIVGADKVNTNVYEAMKHGTLAIGFIGVAEMCRALFGKDHADDKEVHKFALGVVKHISKYAEKSAEKYNLNFSAYGTPAENLCKTFALALRKEFGVIKDITDRDYITNSHHVSVWKEVSIFEKLEIEAPFCVYPTGGCITYIELDSAIMNNHKAIEDIIDYAFNLDIPYLAFNFPIDTCLACGFQGEFNDHCPVCGSIDIQQLRRVTGYLTTDYHNFNQGKQAEVLDRVKHSKYTRF